MIDFGAQLSNYLPMELFFDKIKEDPECHFWREEDEEDLGKYGTMSAGLIKLEKLRDEAELLGVKEIADLRRQSKLSWFASPQRHSIHLAKLGTSAKKMPAPYIPIPSSRTMIGTSNMHFNKPPLGNSTVGVVTKTTKARI